MGAEDGAEPRAAAFHILLLALGAVFAALVAAPDSQNGRTLSAVLLFGSLAAALWVASRSPRLLAAGGLLLAASATGWFGEALGLPSSASVVGTALSAAYFAAAAAVISRRVFRARLITGDTLVGTVCIYLLIALAFACAYLCNALVNPAAFAPAQTLELADFTYLSLVTMTTLGYGDLTPVSGPARALAVVQASAGVLYAAIAVARLVSIHAAGGMRPTPEPDVPWKKRRLRNLFVALTSLVALTIAVGDGGAGWLGHGFAAALLLVTLYALGGGTIAKIAAGPALLALLLRGWTGATGSDGAETLATAIEVLVFGAGIAVVARQAFAQTEVNREVLFGASVLYVFLGIWAGASFMLASKLSTTALEPSGPHTAAQLLYLGFMTFTTTGYGDMLPANRATELISGITACLGVFYPTLLVARLVSLAPTRESAGAD